MRWSAEQPVFLFQSLQDERNDDSDVKRRFLGAVTVLQNWSTERKAALIILTDSSNNDGMKLIVLGVIQ